MLHEAEHICAEAPISSAAWADCRRTLDQLKRTRLDLTASAVNPLGEDQFLSALRRFAALWHRWADEIHHALEHAGATTPN